jgi:hypothetical protein
MEDDVPVKREGEAVERREMDGRNGVSLEDVQHAVMDGVEENVKKCEGGGSEVYVSNLAEPAEVGPWLLPLPFVLPWNVFWELLLCHCSNSLCLWWLPLHSLLALLWL